MDSSELDGCAKHNILRGKKDIMLGTLIMGKKTEKKTKQNQAKNK